MILSMKNFFPFRKISSLILAGALLYGCANHEIHFYTPLEANAMILAAISVNDAKCGMGHTVTRAILFKVEKKAIEACTLKILSLDCTLWAAADPLPLECASMLSHLK